MAQLTQADRMSILRYFNDQGLVAKLVDLVSRYQEGYGSYASPPFGAVTELVSFLAR
jgi:hypothetical protein